MAETLASVPSFYTETNLKHFNQITDTAFQQRKTVILKSYKAEIDELENQLQQTSYNWEKELSGRKAADIAQVSFQLNYKTEFANELIRKIAAIQIKDSAHPYFGNFPKSYDRESGMDQNYATFILPALIYIQKSHSNLLDDDVDELLTELFERALYAVHFMEEDRIPVWYANVYLKVIGTLVMLGDEEQALKSTRKFHDFTMKYGINEYGQWNYVFLQLSALQMAYTYAENPELKSLLKELLEFHWMDTIHHIHEPTMMYSFTSSRAKGSKGLKPGSRLNTLMFLYFGLGDGEGPFSGPQILLTDYQPPASIKKILEAKLETNSFTYQAKYGRVDMQAFQTKEYAIATQSGRRSALGFQGKGKTLLSSEENENSVQILSRDKKSPGVRFKINSVRSDFDHYWVTSIQHKNKAVISYNFDLEGMYLVPSEEKISSVIQFGDINEIEEVQINGSKWQESHAVLSTKDAITINLGASFMGIRFLENEEYPTASLKKPVVVKVKNHQLMLENILFYHKNNNDDDTLFFDAEHHGKRLGYVIIMGSSSDYASLKEFSEELQQVKIQQDVKHTIHTVQADFAKNVQLSIQEDLRTNTILSRKINGEEFDNGFLIKSDFITKEVPDLQQEKEFFKIQLSPKDLDPFSTHVDDKELFHEPKKYNEVKTMNFQKVQGNEILEFTEKGGRASQAFNIPKTGEWKVWVKIANEGASSAAISMQFNSPLRYYFENHQAGHASFIYEVTVNEEAKWRESPDYILHKGSHTVTLFAIEAPVKILEMTLTNDLEFNPSDKNE